jgi:hypothetical protein
MQTFLSSFLAIQCDEWMLASVAVESRQSTHFFLAETWLLSSWEIITLSRLPLGLPAGLLSSVGELEVLIASLQGSCSAITLLPVLRQSINTHTASANQHSRKPSKTHTGSFHAPRGLNEHHRLVPVRRHLHLITTLYSGTFFLQARHLKSPGLWIISNWNFAVVKFWDRLKYTRFPVVRGSQHRYYSLLYLVTSTSPCTLKAHA